MTYARSILVPPGSPGTYHCVSRCVRRAWLCGTDRESGTSFEHRRQWVEDRIHELADIFAVAIWGYAVMSNHLHVVVQVIPSATASWSAEEVAQRWTRLFPRENQDDDKRVQALAGNAERIDVLRRRLADLSWFMRRLSEPIARRANREDGCKGHFWEARFKCQTLLDDTAVLSAMAYVDLNPIRAKTCDSLEASEHTSARVRIDEIDKNHGKAEQALAPLLGLRGFGVLTMSQADYLELVDRTGTEIHPGKRGTITGPPPAALARLGYTPDRWRRQVLAVGSEYYRAIGAAEVLVDKAAEIGQRWLRGIGVARFLKAAAR
jgi:REP element-mobilizing transposase RayT